LHDNNNTGYKHGSFSGKGLGGGGLVNGSVWTRPTEVDIVDCLHKKYLPLYFHRFCELEHKAGVCKSYKRGKFEKDVCRILRKEGFVYRKYASISHVLKGKVCFMNYSCEQRSSRKRILPHEYHGFLELIGSKITVLYNTKIDRVVFKGRCATGAICHDGRFFAAKTIVLSAGALYSPGILLNSGMPPIHHAQSRKTRNIPPRNASDCVGKNLSDRYSLRLPYLISQESLDALVYNGFSVFQVLSSSDNIQISIEKTLSILTYHRMMRAQSTAVMMGWLQHALTNIKNIGKVIHGDYVIEVVVKLLRPYTKGHVEIRDWNTHIHFSPFSHPKDVSCMRTGLAYVKTLHEELSMLKDAHPLYDTALLDSTLTNDETLALMGKYCLPDWHFAGTCAMGSVVDENFRVHGTDNVLVCDMSTCRRSTTLNTMAMSYFIGLCVASVLKERNQRYSR
jgi:choline dehydrogenase-like flavoprotein